MLAIRALFLFCFLLLRLSIAGQEVRILSHIGIATGEMVDRKTIMLSRGVNLGCEFKFEKAKLSITVSPGISNLQYDYTDLNDANVFIRKNFLHIPVSAKKYYTVSRKSNVFFDFGFQTSYFFSDIREIRDSISFVQQNTRNLGWNYGFISAVGFKTLLTRNIFFDIGLFQSKDLWVKYSNSSSVIKTERLSLVGAFNIKL